MKKPTSRSFVQTVQERSERRRHIAKEVQASDIASAPPVEIVRLDGTRDTGNTRERFAIQQGNRAAAWTRVTVTLEELLRHPVVNLNPVAVESVQAWLETACTSTLDWPAPVCQRTR